MNNISLREYFAAHSVSTQAERTMYQQAHGFKEPTRFEDHIACDTAVRYLKADAMIAISGRGNPSGAEKLQGSGTGRPLDELNRWKNEIPAPAQPAPPAESTSNVIERAIALMDKDSPEEAYDLLKKHADTPHAEKSQSDGAAGAFDYYQKLHEGARQIIDLAGKMSLEFKERKIEAQRPSATPKPAATLAADALGSCIGPFGIYENEDNTLHICDGNTRVVLDDSYAYDGTYAATQKRMKWICAALNAALEGKEQQTSARLKGAEAECASLVMQASRNAAEQAVAKERASCAAIVPKLTEIVDFLYSEGCTTSANQLHALNARLTQPSNLSGEGKA
jgi:hypothetical protein